MKRYNLSCFFYILLPIYSWYWPSTTLHHTSLPRNWLPMKDFYIFNLYCYQPTNLNSSMNLQPLLKGLSGSIKTRHHSLTTYNNLECWNVLDTLQEIHCSLWSLNNSKHREILFKEISYALQSPLPFFIFWVPVPILTQEMSVVTREEDLSLIQVAFLWLNWVTNFLGSKYFDFS